MRVLLVDPSEFTPQYDHALAGALARAGQDVELITSRFRFGPNLPAAGYRRRELFYPLSSRLFKRSRLRVPLKLVEHAVGLARLRCIQADVLHFQWLPVPAFDRFLLPPGPAVLTAHDVPPQRFRERPGAWLRALRTFARVVVHSERACDQLRQLGIEPDRVRVIPHPVFASDPRRRDDGHTILCLGLIRPHKGLEDAIAAVRQLEDIRILVAGDPMMPVARHRASAGRRAEWRLGYLSESEIDRALGEATLGVFPYRPGIDQSGALMRTLGAGVPAVVYDVGSLADPVRRFGAGRVARSPDVNGLVAAISELLEEPDELAAARAGARKARETLTWAASATAHLEVYRELTRDGGWVARPR